jgi:hypothetical protein
MIKWISISLLACVFCLIFSLSDYVLFGIYFNLDGMQEPLYAIQDYSQTGFSGSVWQFLLVQEMCRCVAYIFFGVFQIAVAICARDELKSVLLSGTFYAGCIALFFRGKYFFNPIGLLAESNLVRNFEYRQALGTVLLYPVCVLAVVLLMTVILVLFVIWLVGVRSIAAHS